MEGTSAITWIAGSLLSCAFAHATFGLMGLDSFFHGLTPVFGAAADPATNTAIDQVLDLSS